jgi:hypothetical protein
MTINPACFTVRCGDTDRVVPKSRKYSFSPDDLLPLRDKQQRFYPDCTLMNAADMILRLGFWGSSQAIRVSEFEKAIRDVCDRIPESALEVDPTASEIERIKHASKVCLALLVFAASGGRRRLHHIVKSMHKLVLALDDRVNGFDEPLLRVNRSPEKRREDRYAKCVKTWCAIACSVLIAMELPKGAAAEKIASIINKHKLLPSKISGTSIVARSVINWMRRWEDGDLVFLGDADTEFHKSFDYFDKGHKAAARQKVLEILTERLIERKKYRLFTEEEFPNPDVVRAGP